MASAVPAYDPVPDALAFLAAKSPIERHAIARLLALDGAALAVLRWIVDRPECDLATAAMTFWRLRSLGPDEYGARTVDLPARGAVLEAIAANARVGRYAAAEIAWDGLEAWDRTPLIGAPPLEGVAVREDAVPAALAGPFGSATPEPMKYAFFDHDYGDDDIFDAMWRHHPDHVAAADWLAGKPAEVWMAAVDDLRSGHNSDLYAWMLRQPDCPASVAGQIFWVLEPAWAARYRLEGSDHRVEGVEVVELALRRWQAGDLLPCDLDFRRYSDPAGYRAALDAFPGRADPLAIPADLLDPPPGRAPPEIILDEDFDYWALRTRLASIVSRPRSAALAEWERSKAYDAERRRREREAAAAAARPPGLFDRLAYGGKFTGAKAEIDRAWKRFNLTALAGAMLWIALWRVGAPTGLTFAVFLALVAVVSSWLSCANVGGMRRIIGWWVMVLGAGSALAFLFRWIDKGVVG